MRNFWLEASVEGRETMLTGGPRCKDGGMTVKLYMRDNGESVKAVTVFCSENNGELAVSVFDEYGQLAYGKVTER